jgi:hypothetical protein
VLWAMEGLRVDGAKAQGRTRQCAGIREVDDGMSS